jgi:hypothetical protein
MINLLYVLKGFLSGFRVAVDGKYVFLVTLSYCKMTGLSMLFRISVVRCRNQIVHHVAVIECNL